MKTIAATVQDEKKVIQLKYLLSMPSSQNKQQLLDALNKLYPFSQYPLQTTPPIQLFETKSSKIITQNVAEELENNSFIIVTGGLVISKGVHQHMENKFLAKEDLSKLHFKSIEGNFQLRTSPYTCYIKIHNIWIEMAKKRHQIQTSEFIKKKLLNVPFFANLSFQQFDKCCKAATLISLGPGDTFLKTGETPYNMYVVLEGQLVYEKKVKFLKDKQLWNEMQHQMHRKQQDSNCKLMFKYLIKDPRPHEQTFEVIFQVKLISENQMICARQTLDEEPLTYDIVSSFKTKIACIKYSDFYQLNPERLAEIRSWPLFTIDDIQLRKEYYYQMQWQEFKQQIKRLTKMETLEKKKFEDFLRKAVDLSQQKYYFCPDKIGDGTILDSPVAKMSKIKQMTQIKSK